MKIDRTTLLFFDSSCLIAAAGSPDGGSGFILSLCARGYLLAVISLPVLMETQINIRTHLQNIGLERLYSLLNEVPFQLAPVPNKTEISNLQKAVNTKDVHVVAAAMEVEAPFLLTLDKKLALEVNNAQLGIQAFSPGEFIKNVLVQHEDYQAK